MDPSLALFGKLHGHGDFVQAGNTSPAVLELREWVEGGVARASAHPQFAARFDEGIAFAFVYRAKTVQGRCVVGIMAPSRDTVGRRFPLIVGLETDASPFASFPHLPPLAFGGALQTLYERVHDGVRAGNLKALVEPLEQLGALPISPVIDEARAYTEWTQRATVASAFAWIYDSFEPEGLDRTMAFIRSAAAPCRGQSEPQTPVALRFPLGASGSGGASLWLDLVRRTAEWSQMVPTCFWSVSSRRSELLVQLGLTPSTTFGELWAPRDDSEHICDLLNPVSLEPLDETQRRLEPQASVFDLLCSL